MHVAWAIIRQIIPIACLRRSLLATIQMTSSACTGVYTAEMAQALVVQAVNESDVVFSTDLHCVACHEKNEACHQIIYDTTAWVSSVTGKSHSLPCVFGDMMDLFPCSTFDGTTCFIDSFFRARSARLARHMHCKTHNGFCPIPNSEFEIAGLPCQPNSSVGVRAYEDDPRFLVYIAWTFLNFMRGTLCLVLENVKATLFSKASFFYDSDYLEFPSPYFHCFRISSMIAAGLGDFL